MEKKKVGQLKNDYSGLVDVLFWMLHHDASCAPLVHCDWHTLFHTQHSYTSSFQDETSGMGGLGQG